ncbi:unnamed protein product [Orchesella dallaii]|uniref:Uncharacterized protein n=1 Tax=Orchesella dallaii TaxID=48710 RepID=A0ABP1S916_9HEXA
MHRKVDLDKSTIIRYTSSNHFLENLIRLKRTSIGEHYNHDDYEVRFLKNKNIKCSSAAEEAKEEGLQLQHKVLLFLACTRLDNIIMDDVDMDIMDSNML